MAYSFPRPQLVKILCKDVWNPPRGKQTLADLTREDSAAVWAAINLKLTTALFNAKIFFKNDMVMVWEPKYAPAVDDILRFSKEYKEAVMFMMYRIGSMHSLMDGPNHPCLDSLNGYDDALNDLHVHAKLVVELNMDSINVHFKRHEDNTLHVEFNWSAAAVAQFQAEAIAAKPK
jgi:hypothetical protein